MRIEEGTKWRLFVDSNSIGVCDLCQLEQLARINTTYILFREFCLGGGTGEPERVFSNNNVDINARLADFR